jgi:MFS family permease
VTAFWQFLILRMLTGIAMGGVFPLVFSLLADLFPVSRRAAMSALIQLATGFGIGLGQVRGCRVMAADLRHLGPLLQL